MGGGGVGDSGDRMDVSSPPRAWGSVLGLLRCMNSPSTPGPPPPPVTPFRTSSLAGSPSPDGVT